MKKLLGAILVIFMALACFSACTNGRETPITPEQPTESGQLNQPTEGEKPEQPSETEHSEQEEITKMYLTVNGNKLEVALEENSSVDALVEILKKGDITFTAEENGNFEMYGDIGHTLPTNNTQISAQAGDVILYAGRYLCLFFGNNSYFYTQIGKIKGYSSSQLRTLLGAEQRSVQVAISLS